MNTLLTLIFLAVVGQIDFENLTLRAGQKRPGKMRPGKLKAGKNWASWNFRLYGYN